MRQARGAGPGRVEIQLDELAQSQTGCWVRLMLGPACSPGELKLAGHPIMVLRGACVSRRKDIGPLADVAMADMAPTGWLLAFFEITLLQTGRFRKDR